MNNLSFRPILIVILIMIAFYLLISTYSGLEEIAGNFSSTNFLFIPLIIGIVLSSIVIRSFIQKLLLDQLDVQLSLKQNFPFLINPIIGNAFRKQLTKRTSKK